MRTHTGEKPYKCKFCDKAFSESNVLVKHIRTHVGKNIYECKECPASFRLQGELREHIRMHFIDLKAITTDMTDENQAEISDDSKTETKIHVTFLQKQGTRSLMEHLKNKR